MAKVEEQLPLRRDELRSEFGKLETEIDELVAKSAMSDRRYLLFLAEKMEQLAGLGFELGRITGHIEAASGDPFSAAAPNPTEP